MLANDTTSENWKKESLLGTNLFFKKKNRQKVTMIHFFWRQFCFFKKKSCPIFAFFLFVGRVSLQVLSTGYCCFNGPVQKCTKRGEEFFHFSFVLNMFPPSSHQVPNMFPSSQSVPLWCSQ